MVDSIVLRLHGIKKHRNLLKSFDQTGTKGYTVKEGKVDPKEITSLQKMGVTNPMEVVQLLQMNGTGKFLMKTKVAKHMNRSSHYELTYFVNQLKDYIELNFSIPKYVYGSNILMFTDHIGDREYTYECNELEHNIQKAYKRLFRFLQEFFRLECIHMDPDVRDIEVNRIDVCFNQVFRSKEEALKYLEYQKGKSKKYAREGKEGLTDYATSIMYKTDRYSAKIYHKGSEYRVHDLKEHLRINEQKGRKYFRTEEYQAFADRILRYELTIRNNMLNYLHKTHLFRKHCHIWRHDKKIYQEVEATLQRNDRLAQKVAALQKGEQEAFLQAHPYERVKKKDRQIYRQVSKLISKHTLFTLFVDEEHTLYNEKTVNYSSDRAQFCPKLLKLCFDKLVEFMEEYQIKELPEEAKVEKAIEEYNVKHRRKLPKTEMLNFYNDLLRVGSFKEVARINYMHRATMYRYKQRFKKIEITDNNLVPLTPAGIPGAPLDLRDYHAEHLFNARFLMKNNFMDMV